MITKFNISWQIICIFSKSHLLTVVKSFIFLSSYVMSLIALTNINQITSFFSLFLWYQHCRMNLWTSSYCDINVFKKSINVSGFFCFVGVISIGLFVCFSLFCISFETRIRRQLTALGHAWSVLCDVNVASRFTFLFCILAKNPLKCSTKLHKNKANLQMKCLSGCVVAWVLILHSLWNIYFVYLLSVV